MLPQFGYIVAQAGADYYSLPRSPPPPSSATVSQTPSGPVVTQQPQQPSQSHQQQQQQPKQQGNGSIPALAPLLNNKPFGFGSALQSSTSALSASSSSNDNYYKSNPSNGNFNTPPYYSRQPSPSPSSSNIPILPPPSFLYSNATSASAHLPGKDIIPKAGFQQPILEKKKETSWYSPLPPAPPPPLPPATANGVPHPSNIPTPTHHYHHHHQHQAPQSLPPPPPAPPSQAAQQHHHHPGSHALYHIKPNSPPQRVASPFYDHPVIDDDRNVQPVSHSSTKWQQGIVCRLLLLSSNALTDLL